MHRMSGISEHNNGFPSLSVSIWMEDYCNRYLWSTTEIHVTADGAANLLYSMFPEDRDTFIPDYIIVASLCGDEF